jgi:type IV pilus assembly protein PilM
MSTAESTHKTALDLSCGHCSHVNLFEAKFCGGCGSALFEPCAGCQEPVRLNQRFCGLCGTDLESAFAKQLEAREQTLVDALNDAKNFRYDIATSRLKRLAAETDFRFAQLASNAKAAISKIEELESVMKARVAKAQSAALVAEQRGDKLEVQKLLSDFPNHLLDEEARAMLARAKAFNSETQTLQEELKAALARKDLLLAGTLIGRLIELFPNEDGLIAMARQIAQKLIAKSESLFANQKYSEALECLHSVPSACQDETFSETRQRIQTADWLTQQFSAEPYATPTLGRLAVRLSKHSPDDPLGKSLATDIAARLKQSTASVWEPYPHWSNRRKSSLGGDVAILGWSKSIACKGDANIKKMPARFNVAFGLALQGLGDVKINTRFAEKKSLLSALTSRRKSKTCWGIDIGTTSIKAALLQRDATETVVIDSYTSDYPPLTRLGQEGQGLLAVRDAIKKLVEEKHLEKTEVWVSFPSREVLSRFIELPPVDDKKAKALLDKEAIDQFPVDLDELDLMKWSAEKPSVTGVGRPAALIAARKMKVTQRLDFLSEAGLKVAGLQCESLALANFAYHEFSDLLQVEEGSLDYPAIALVDVGATATTLLVIDRDGFWFRSIEGGGEDVTMAIARSAKVVAAEAEKLKRDPSSLSLPDVQYQPVEEKQLAMASRLKQIAAEPLKHRRNLKILQTWVVGGGSFGFGWLRRVLCEHD